MKTLEGARGILIKHPYIPSTLVANASCSVGNGFPVDPGDAEKLRVFSWVTRFLCLPLSGSLPVTDPLSQSLAETSAG